jgi:protein-L-isoaspartate(D-aspartate) O-methyltransferase
MFRDGLIRLALLTGLPLGFACVTGSNGNGASAEADRAEETWTARRRAMVTEQLERRGIRDPLVLDAMGKVPRHRFVPDSAMTDAYDDSPLPIGFGQTISQPFIVAYMTEALELKPEHRVLEIGTGSGYQAAVLGELAREVYTIEIVPALADDARRTLAALGYANVHVRTGDGYVGWEEAAPFDRIILTAAPDHVPQPLVDQLAIDGRLIAPVGRVDQWIRILTRTRERLVEETTIPVRFVPLVRSSDSPR